MSDFKFNCPACGQKIACDTGYSGAQIACPSCQKTLTVPAAPAGATAAPVVAAVAAPARAMSAPAPAAPAPVPPARPPAGPQAKPQPGYRPLPQVPGELAKSPASAARPGEVTNIDPGYCPQAIASLICSVVFVIGWIPGIILGHVAKSRMRRDPLLDGNGMATAGLVISYSMLILILATSAGFAVFLKGLKPVTVIRETPEAIAILKPRVVDEVQPGDPSSESAHAMQVRMTRMGAVDPAHRWRDAYQGGLIRYTMKVLPDQPMSLNCRYWGNDAERRLFDVVVNDQIIGTQKLDFTVPGHYFDVEYKIPSSLTAGKTEVTVELAAHPGMTAGGLFGLQTLKR